MREFVVKVDEVLGNFFVFGFVSFENRMVCVFFDDVGNFLF